MRKKIFKAAVWVAGFVALFTIIGFLVVPPIMKSVLVSKLSEALHRQVRIEKIRFNPYTLHLSVKGIDLTERDGKERFFSLGELSARLSIASIYRLAPIVKELKIDRPYIRVVRNTDQSFNFSDIIAEATREKPVEKEKKARPFLFSVNNILINDGRVDFLDRVKNIEHVVKEICLGVPFISNIGDKVHVYVDPTFAANVNGDFYSFKGKTKPFEDSLESFVDIHLKDFDIPRYMPYLPVKANFVLKSAVLNVVARASFRRSRDKGPSSVVTGTVTLKDVAADDLAGKPLLRLGLCELSIAELKPFEPSLHLSKVGLAGLELMVTRSREGTLNLASLVSGEERKEKKIPPAPEKRPAEAEETGLPPIKVDEFRIDGGSVSFEDIAPGGPVKLDVTDLTVKGEGVTTIQGGESALTASLLLNKKGTVSVSGPVSINPLSANLAVTVKGIDIRAFQPYFSHKVKLAVTKGQVETKGALSVGQAGKGDLRIKYSGNALVSNFASVDKGTGDDLFKWKALSLNRIDAATSPLRVRINGISLADFYAGLAVEPDGALNLKKIVMEEGAAATPSATKPGAPALAKKTEKAPPGKETEDIAVGAITLQGGSIEFIDKSINPRFSASLEEIAGRIAGFSLGKDQNAEVDLKGKINENIPLEITGTVNPAKENLFADLKVKFTDLELSDMSPYAAKYMGYKIEKGKLSIDLKYLIAKRKLDSENRIFIDQLTLGEKVDSPDALNLPFRLAIALLKDRHGRITLDVPVSGSFDDPQFSVFRIILKIIGNLIAKAATAPFALLASLVGGGEEMSYLEFPYGSSALSPENLKKIDTLTKALYERPQLKVDIEGRVDPGKDKEALRTNLFDRKLKVQKMNVMVKKGLPVESVDDIKIEPAEYEQYLAMAYKAETFAKPRNVIGLEKGLPRTEMEKLMVTHINITDGDLRALARQRALHAKDAIVKSGRVNSDRLFLVEPKITSPEKKEKAGANRVNFSLK
ncbi:MAG TPA: DUF748 domain-containing protein [Syntrophorhabdaceae bacterium]